MAASGKLAGAYGIRGAIYSAVDNPPSYAQRFASLEPGRWYFKMGRTTDITTGICHGIEVDINRTEETRFDELGAEVKLEKRPTRELMILDKQTYWANVRPFCQSGDSGSFVFNHRGRVAGLMYGEFSGLRGQSIKGGLVTSMDEVLASIKAKTGADLFLS